ncbi:MAG: TIGR04076 family protein [Candidatus Methanomethylicota archaeon]|uniref:TIGR04076 family protein n=1 Tax=Thermoproteota archaeon TaxID=2056631 RepID=A0A497ENF5_9CREN|nr:MAG: TIGR04076 family protein [Candidatus Verstraetearchaeota archaeon]
MRFKVRVSIIEVRGYCAAGYKPGDSFTIEWFYLQPKQDLKICLHAINAMTSLLLPFLKGISAKQLGIGEEDDVGYIQCPDPGKPYTSGGTVVFKLERERIE